MKRLRGRLPIDRIVCFTKSKEAIPPVIPLILSGQQSHPESDSGEPCDNRNAFNILLSFADMSENSIPT